MSNDKLAEEMQATVQQATKLAARLSGPTIKRHRSAQDIGTPRDFLDAIENRFGKIDFDLAASAQNAVCLYYWTEQDNALVQPWDQPGYTWRVAWLNPPFGNIGPWAKKCAECMWLPRWTLLLVPCSPDSNWHRHYVRGKALEIDIPRIKFVGATHVYPKPLQLHAYGFGVQGREYWDYRKPWP